MKKETNKIIQMNDISLLNKKRKKKQSEIDYGENEQKEKNKIKKIEIKNCLKFSLPPKNDIFNKYSDIHQYSIARKVYTSSSKYEYNYICQEIETNKIIQVKDASILYYDNIIFLFLLSDSILYIYEIKNNFSNDLIKTINLNSDNKFIFSNVPKNIFFIAPQEKNKRKKEKDKINNINNNKTIIKTKDILYLCILSNKEKYLCTFDLKKYVFKNLKNFEKKNMPKKLINNELNYKIYNKNKILCYNNNCTYTLRIFGSPKIKDFKHYNIESTSLLNHNLFSICTPDVIYIYNTSDENFIGDFKTNSKNKKAKLLRPENNLLMVKSEWDIAFYDLESLMFFQKFDINNINNPDEPIQKVKQLSTYNISILFLSCFAIYNLEKNAITFKCNYLDNYNINSIGISNDLEGTLIQLNHNFILVNSDKKNFYIINSIKGDKIASLNINNENFTLCKKIKQYNFISGISLNKNIEEKKNDNNFILLVNSKSNFILSSIRDDK